MKNNELYVFFHMSKTGGTTFTNHLSSCFSDSPLSIPMLNDYQKKLAESENRIYWPNETIENKLKAKIISGHDANPINVQEIKNEKLVKYIVFIRKPSARIVSLYNYSKSVGLIDTETSFYDWLEIVDDFAAARIVTQINSFFRLFLGWSKAELIKYYTSGQQEQLVNLAINEISKFFFLGLHENYTADMLELTNYLELPPITKSYNITGRDHPRLIALTPEIDSYLKAKFPEEFVFYDRILALRKKRGSPFFLT